MAGLPEEPRKREQRLRIATSASETRPDAVTWQAASDELLTAARRVETLSAVVLGVSTPKGTYEAVPSQLLAALAHLSSRVEQCRKLLAEPN